MRPNGLASEVQVKSPSGSTDEALCRGAARVRRLVETPQAGWQLAVVLDCVVVSFFSRNPCRVAHFLLTWAVVAMAAVEAVVEKLKLALEQWLQPTHKREHACAELGENDQLQGPGTIGVFC